MIPLPSAINLRPTCGRCPQLEDIGSTDTGKCRIDGKLHDIMETACGHGPGPEGFDDKP